MKVSIITPVYNSERYLAATLESVLAQTLPEWELIVVNDGSTDSSGEIAESFQKRDQRIRVLHQMNAGVAEARNRGLRAATSPYISLLDHDDLYEPDALALLTQELENRPEYAAIHGQRRQVTADGASMQGSESHVMPIFRRYIKGSRLAFLPENAPTAFSALAYNDPIPANAILVRREVFESVGLFDPKSVPADDWDMWIRISLQGTIGFIPEIIYAWRSHEGNLSHQRQKMQNGVSYVRRKTYLNPLLTAEQRRMIILGYRFSELRIARQKLQIAKKDFLHGRIVSSVRQLPQAAGHLSRFLWGRL